MRPEIVFASLWLWLSALLSPGGDAPVTYTGRATWDVTIVGESTPYYGDFSGLTQDTYFRNQPVQCGFLTPRQDGGDGRVNYVTASLDQGGMWTTGGLSAGSPTSVEMRFDDPLWAWWSDYGPKEPGDTLDLELYGSSGVLMDTVPVTVKNGSFAFTTSASVPMETLVFQPGTDTAGGSDGEPLTMDNVSGAPLHTPELPPGALLAIGLVPVIILARRRRRKGCTEAEHQA